MFKEIIRLSFVLLVINIAISFCEGLSGGYNEHFTSLYKENSQKISSVFNLNELINPNRGLGISAWGIVILVVLFFLLVVGMYYISICYPVCKRNQKKHLIEA